MKTSLRCLRGQRETSKRGLLNWEPMAKGCKMISRISLASSFLLDKKETLMIQRGNMRLITYNSLRRKTRKVKA